MGSFSGSSSATKVVNDENKMPEYSLPTGKPPSDQKASRNIMLEKFQANVKPSLGRYAYIPKLSSFTALLWIHCDSKTFFSFRHRQSSNQPE